MRSLMRVSSVEIAASPLGGRAADAKATADVQEASTVAPARSAGWLATDRTRNGPVRGSTGRWGPHALPRRVQSHFPSIVYMRGYQREQSVDTVGRAPAPRRARRRPGPRPDAVPRRPPSREPTAEEVEALREVHARLVATPVEDVVANHALGIWQLALVHLGVITPPDADGHAARARPRGGRARDRRDGRARRRARRAARRARGGAARRADPGADAVRRGLRSGPTPSAVSRERRSTGRAGRPLRAARAARRPSTCRRSPPPPPRTAATYDWTPVPDGEAEFRRERRARARASTRPAAGSRSRPCAIDRDRPDASSAPPRSSTRSAGRAAAAGSTASRSARPGSRRRRSARP